MENMDKGLAVPKRVLINRPKISQMSQNLSSQIVCSSPKFGILMKKRLHWVSVVRALKDKARGEKHKREREIYSEEIWNGRKF